MDKQMEEIREILATVKPEGVWLPPKKAYRQEEEEVIALVSDCQIGTKSLGAETGIAKEAVWGTYGTYNADVFRYRLRLWTRSVVRITSLMRAKIPVRKLNLWFLGDLLENEWIWRGQGSYIETGLLQQFYIALYEFAQAISYLAKHFEVVEIRAVSGNHGRGTPRPRESKTWVNWEWLWYRYLELVCRELANVKFNLSLSWFDEPEVQGHTFLMLHGEDVRRYMRFPWYGLDRLEKNYSELMESLGRPFEYLVVGHHHILSSYQTSKGEWFCNGNWVGPTVFTLKVLYEAAEPKQWLLFCHPKKGIASRWAVDLTVQDEALWRHIEKTRYDVHVPASNEELLQVVS